MADVRRNNFRCNQCLQDKLHKDAKELGLMLIGAGRSRHYKTYRFDQCGHEQEIHTGALREKEFSCQTCIVKKHHKEAKNAGLKLIGAGRNRHHKTYRFDQCGHEQEIHLSDVRNNNVRCHQCFQDKLDKEAKAVGLTLLGAGRNNASRTYRFNKCGHTRSIEMADVRRNNFRCNTCEETSRDLPSKVYLLKIQSGSFIWLKLGYAKTVKTRIREYRLPEDAKVKRLKVIDFKTGREAHEFESKLHTKHKRKRLPMKKMKEFHKNGYNECYPLEMLDKLLEELESG
jgi:predicted nucleic acid-binding Zn ribbon protein